MGFAGRGEAINENSYYGLIRMWWIDEIPVLRFHWKWSDNEIKMAKDMQGTFHQISQETAGGHI